MADRELRLDLLARDQTGPATKSAADNLDDVADAADDAAKSTDRLGRSADNTADQVDKLTREIDLVEKELGDLHAAFARTDDAAERMDLSKGIRRMESDLRKLNKSKTALSALLPDPAEIAAQAAEVGVTVGEGIAENTTKSLGRAAGPMVPILAGVAIAATPIIGATIAAAVIGGVGVGGVIGGIKLAASDSRVKQAGKMLGQVLLEDLQTRATRSFAEPILQATTRITRGFAGMGDDLERIFSNSSKFVQPLTEGLLGFTQRVTAGIADLTDAAGPVIDVISHGVAELGDAIGDVFSDLEDNGVDAAVALNAVFQVLEGTIRGTGAVVNALTESFGFLAKYGAFGRDAQLEYARLEANARLAARANEDAAESLAQVKTAGATAAGAIDKAAGAMTNGKKSAYGQRDAIVALNNALRAQTDPVFGLLDAQGRLKQAQEAAATATRTHGRNSDEAKEALRRQAEAILEVQGRAGELGKAFNGTLSPALRETLRDGGMTAWQINELEKQFAQARREGDRFAKDYNATATLRMRVFGSTAANAALATARALAGYREAGGPVKAGHAYVVGEKRPEVFVPDRDGKIIPSVEQYHASGASSAGGGGRSAQTIHLVVHTAPDADRRVAGMFRYSLRSTGGDATIAGGI